MDFVRRWSEKTEVGAGRFNCVARHHRQQVLRLAGTLRQSERTQRLWEKQAIIGFHLKNPLAGYRRLTFMMQDADIVAVSPSSVASAQPGWTPVEVERQAVEEGYRLRAATDGASALAHLYVSYLNIGGTLYYLCSILDGYSRYIVNWDIRESMTEANIEIILQRAKETYPEARPRIISDNGPQFIAKDCKEFIRTLEMTHVCTSPFYPQSKGKIERWHKSLKGECIRPGKRTIDRNDMNVDPSKGFGRALATALDQFAITSAARDPGRGLGGGVESLQGVNAWKARSM